MADDRAIIEALEKQTGKRLDERFLAEIMGGINGYALAADGRVVGLNLGGAGITDLSLIGQLTGLTLLQLGANKISDLSPLAGLTALTKLLLHNNQLTGLSPLAGLTALTALWLNNNQLVDLSPLAGLKNLKGLYLYNNQLTDISPLAGLTALTELYLYENQLTDLTPLAGLKELIYLDLRDNAITQVPESLVLDGRPITWERKDYSEPGLFLEGNPLETPPIEVVKQGHEAVVNYFQELAKKEAPVRLLQSKLLLVGNGEVGKTTLMKKLINNKFKVVPGKEATTHGIHIAPWKLEVPFKDTEAAETREAVTLHFWDFGGQDIYHATHQFFLTKRSLYLFVWEVRREEETRSFDYWLYIV